MMKTIVAIVTVLLSYMGTQGQTIWTKDMSSSPTFSVVTPSVIDVGYARSVWAFGPSVMLLDINGDVVWQKKFPGNFVISDMILTPNHDIILVGFMTKMVGNMNRDVAVIVKINMLGDILWNKQYESPNFSAGAICVQRDDNGNFVVGGWKSDELGGIGNIQGLLLHLDASGSITSSAIIQESTSISDVEWLSSGNVVAVGSRDESVVGDYMASSISVFALDPDNNFLWWNDYSMVNSYSTGVGLNLASNGNLLVFGESGDRDFALIELDTDGNTNSTTRINQSSQMEAVQMEVNFEGTIHLGGNLKITSPQGDVYWRPMGVRILDNGNQEFAQFSTDIGYNSELLGSICTFEDGSYAWLSQGQSSVDFRKLDVVVVSNECSMLQPNFLYTFDDLLESNDVEVSVIPTVLTSNGGLNFAATNNVMNTLCSANLCNESVLVYSDGVVKCEGDTFVYQSLESFDTYNWYIDGNFVSSSPIDSVSFSDWGFYELKLEAYTTQLCPANDILNLTVLPNPVVNLTVPDTINFCQGETAIISTDTEFSTYIWNTGNNTQAITVGSTNQYWVDVIADNGCTVQSDTVSVFSHLYPNPTLNLTGDTIFCANIEVELSTEEYATYLWSSGDTTQVIYTSNPGVYFVEVSTEFGCASISDSLSLSTWAVPSPQVLASGPLTWCAPSDSTVVLSTNDGYDQVMWSNEVADSSQVVDISGFYYYLATNSLGCSAYSDTLTVISWPIPIIDIQFQESSFGSLCLGSVELNVIAQTLGYTVVWSDFPDESGLTLSDLCTGSFEVIITDDNGCQASDIIVIDSGIGVEDLENSSILIYPNPVENVLHFKGIGNVIELIIMDSSGKIVRNKARVNSGYDVSNLSPGTYTLQLVTIEGEYLNQSFVKR